MRVKDARGRKHQFAAPPQRVVSLIPSYTELLFELGLEERVVGVTDFCVHPEEGVRRKTRVGGTKNPAVSRIRELEPELVIANKEENRRRDVERLEEAGIPVFVTYARTVKGALAEMRTLGKILGCADAAQTLAHEIEAVLEAVRARRPKPRPRVVALIWKTPYMAVSGDTFAHDMLVQSGGRNPFRQAERRYPRIDEEELLRARPDVILLPTEPYAFGEKDRLELLGLDCPASKAGRVHVVEGELLSWYGPRMARALRVFAELLRG